MHQLSEALHVRRLTMAKLWRTFGGVPAVCLAGDTLALVSSCRDVPRQELR